MLFSLLSIYHGGESSNFYSVIVKINNVLIIFYMVLVSSVKNHKMFVLYVSADLRYVFVHFMRYQINISEIHVLKLVILHTLLGSGVVSDGVTDSTNLQTG